MRLRIEDAAALADASYAIHTLHAPRVDLSCPHEDVQAFVLSTGVLLLPGSNSLRDYLRYNLRPLRLGTRRLKMADGATEQGASGTFWHQGFLGYAKVVYDWLAGENIRPGAIIGHSLGAAAAQILGKTYAVPTIGFAAPRPVWDAGGVMQQSSCLIINRADDLVPSLPPRFHHMTTPTVLSPKHRNAYAAHKMRSYRAYLDDGSAPEHVPDHWPLEAGPA